MSTHINDDYSSILHNDMLHTVCRFIPIQGYLHMGKLTIPLGLTRAVISTPYAAISKPLFIMALDSVFSISI